MERTTPTRWIHVDRSRCEGLGVCELQAPEYFEVQDDRTLQIRSAVARTDLDRVRGSVESCPNRALALVDSPPSPNSPSDEVGQ